MCNKKGSLTKNLPKGLQELYLLDENARRWLGLLEGGGDKVTSQWIGLDSIIIPLTILAIYLSLVFTVHQRIKKIKLSIKPLLFLYNLVQVGLCAYLVLEIGTCIKLIGFTKLNCIKSIATYKPIGRRVAQAIWGFHMLKYVDLLETVFFILRGNIHQVTVLHVFHHTTMIFNSWIMARHDPTGLSIIIPLINCVVHSMMYSYYFFSTFGPKVQKYLWWKKYLTQIQMLQFIILMIILICGLKYKCSVISPLLIYYAILYNAIMFLLFINFYRKSYYLKRKSQLRRDFVKEKTR